MKVPPDVPIGLCECGCARQTPLARKSYPALRRFKGHPLPLIPGHRRRLKQDGIRQLSETEAAYLAGLIDGEGSIYIRPGGRRSIRVTVANTDIHVMDWLRGIGGSVIRNRLHGSLGRLVVYSWGVSSWRNSLAVLHAVAPFLIIKKQRALDALALLAEYLSSGQDPPQK